MPKNNARETIDNANLAAKAKKFLMVGPKTKAVVNFRGDLLCDIKKKGYEVVVVVPENVDKSFFKQNGIKVRLVNLNKNSLSVFGAFSYYRNLKKIIKEEAPDKVFSFTIKPVIFGSIAANRAGVKEIYSLICGLGMIFSSDTLKMHILRFVGSHLYKYALKYNKKVIFQNRDDINEFVARELVKRSQCELVNGSGVNLKKFSRNNLPKDKVSFLMVSRVIKEKGVMEYFKAAKIVKEKYPDAEFAYIGAIDKNKNAINMEELKPFIDEGVIKYIPETNHVEKYVGECSVFVLPTYYREGIPRTLLEAMAMGRPILTTNTPGCRETIAEGENGYFVKAKRAKDLADKIIYMIEHRSDLQKMGDKSYQMCLEKFTIEIIDERMLEVMGVE
ncbi:glycosyltransferase family 4 protein [Candidatus Saccharibacteria bacterium]|nr:glycosyltransferase family 4 protein [Candidatus Saccharibacteria bacterium]